MDNLCCFFTLKVLLMLLAMVEAVANEVLGVKVGVDILLCLIKLISQKRWEKTIKKPALTNSNLIIVGLDKPFSEQYKLILFLI